MVNKISVFVHPLSVKECLNQSFNCDCFNTSSTFNHGRKVLFQCQKTLCTVGSKRIHTPDQNTLDVHLNIFSLQQSISFHSYNNCNHISAFQ